MKRLYRNLNEKTKKAISKTMSGRTLSESHKTAISKALKEYWSKIPYKDEREVEDEQSSM